MAKLAFCDYHNMVAILEKTKSNTDFHHIVDFLEASHIRVETVDGETKIIAKVNGRQRTVTESSIRRHLKLLDDEEDQTTSPEPIPQETTNQTTSPEHIPQATTLPSQSHPDISTPRRLTRGAIRISQSKAPTPGADETAYSTRDDRYGEAFPTATSLDVGQDRENIAKTSTMPHEASPGVTSLGGGEGSMQQKLQELMDMGMDQGEDLMVGDVEKSTEKGSDNTDEAANVLSTLEAANVLSSGSFSTAVIFTTVSVTTPYTRRTKALKGIIIEPSHTTSVPTISAKGKGKEKMVEFLGTKKKKIQEQLDAQLAKELEYKFAQEEQLIREQGEKDAEIARAQAEKELGMMIAERLQRSIQAIQNVCSPSSQILALDFLAFNLGPMGLEGIAKVAIAVYKVGFKESDGE
ncbi:hypothetical protein Tco_0581472 [Tanacetum coccineum]